MKIILATVVVLGLCSLFAAGSPAGDVPSNSPSVPDVNNFANSRFFFGSGSDPCANSLYTNLNIADFKCSLQCFFQGGTQQGGYCDSGACQCNVVTDG